MSRKPPPIASKPSRKVENSGPSQNIPEPSVDSAESACSETVKLSQKNEEIVKSTASAKTTEKTKVANCMRPPVAPKPQRLVKQSFSPQSTQDPSSFQPAESTDTKALPQHNGEVLGPTFAANTKVANVQRPPVAPKPRLVKNSVPSHELSLSGGQKDCSFVHQPSESNALNNSSTTTTTCAFSSPENFPLVNQSADTNIVIQSDQKHSEQLNCYAAIESNTVPTGSGTASTSDSVDSSSLKGSRIKELQKSLFEQRIATNNRSRTGTQGKLDPSETPHPSNSHFRLFPSTPLTNPPSLAEAANRSSSCSNSLTSPVTLESGLSVGTSCESEPKEQSAPNFNASCATNNGAENTDNGRTENSSPLFQEALSQDIYQNFSALKSINTNDETDSASLGAAESLQSNRHDSTTSEHSTGNQQQREAEPTRSEKMRRNALNVVKELFETELNFYANVTNLECVRLQNSFEG